MSRLAEQFAAEISNHYWGDAPYRADRAGHRPEDDHPSRRHEPLPAPQADNIRMNVMWVVAQVLGYNDPNFDVYEFAEASGVDTTTSTGRRNRGIEYGLRRDGDRYCKPGTRDVDEG
ncbi:hypothetical protein [Thermomonospora umbrina]|uniref:hypothetical protein n=1 Tax=Thermomonospora umbrina TaxID=111806 RepID=UPI0011C1A064|nr:hypothetical protein [Thermomonospora umbrina]